MSRAQRPAVHLGISLGRLDTWHDGLGEFSRQVGRGLAERAAQLRAECGWELHFHLPERFHGCFGPEVHYLATHTSQRLLHLRGQRFALWHLLHQHIRLKAPLGTAHQLETVHDLNFLHAKSPAKIERYRALMRKRLAQRDAAVAITHYVAQDLARELAPLPVPVRVIHNGATDLTGVAREPVAGLGDAPFLLHISRMAPSKNIEALLALAAVWPEQRIVLAGAPSPYTEVVQRLVAERGLHNVHIRLDVSEAQKAWLYAQCQGFLFPSLAEGFGLPPIEAMHFGKPVFLSRRTCLPEVGGEVAHYFADDFEPQGMRAVVQAGLAQAHQPGAAEAIARHAQRFSWRTCVDGYVACYRQLLNP